MFGINKKQENMLFTIERSQKRFRAKKQVFRSGELAPFPENMSHPLLMLQVISPIVQTFSHPNLPLNPFTYIGQVYIFTQQQVAGKTIANHIQDRNLLYIYSKTKA